MAEWKDSSGPWPSHGCDQWNETLAVARAAGWLFKKYTSHRFGVIQCRLAADPSDRCQVKIESSASGTESFARDTIKTIDRCPHRPSAPAERAETMSVKEADRCLDKAETFLTAARRCTVGRRKVHQAYALLEEAEQHLDRVDESVDGVVDEAVGLEKEGLEDLRRALAAASQLGTPLADETGSASSARPEPALSAGEALLDAVDEAAASTSDWDAVRARSGGLRGIITEVRSALASGEG